MKKRFPRTPNIISGPGNCPGMSKNCLGLKAKHGQYNIPKILNIETIAYHVQVYSTYRTCARAYVRLISKMVFILNYLDMVDTASNTKPFHLDTKVGKGRQIYLKTLNTMAFRVGNL
jgi:hypothetical protein